MRRSLSIPAAGLGFALVILSVMANSCFGYLLTDTQERFLYAFLFAVLDASKAFLLPIRDALLENDHTRKAKCALAAFWVFGMSSFACEVGLYKIVKGRASGVTATAAAAVKATEESKNAAESALKDLRLSGTYFPVIDLKTINLPTIDLAIQNAELHDLWRRSGSCKDVTKDNSRVFCKDHNTLVAAAANRKTIDDYNEVAQSKEGQETRNQAGKKDEQAAAFARWLHVAPETVCDVLACIIAFLIEAGSILLPWFSFSPARNRQEPAIPAIPEMVLPPPAPPPAVVAVLEEDAAERTTQAWLDTSAFRRRGNFTTSADIWAHYTANCKAPQLDRTALGSFLRARGFTAVKKGGIMRYEGIVLAPIGKPPLRLAADNTKGLGVGAGARGAGRGRGLPQALCSSASPPAGLT